MENVKNDFIKFLNIETENFTAKKLEEASNKFGIIMNEGISLLLFNEFPKGEVNASTLMGLLFDSNYQLYNKKQNIFNIISNNYEYIVDTENLVKYLKNIGCKNTDKINTLGILTLNHQQFFDKFMKIINEIK